MQIINPSFPNTTDLLQFSPFDVFSMQYSSPLCWRTCARVCVYDFLICLLFYYFITVLDLSSMTLLSGGWMRSSLVRFGEGKKKLIVLEDNLLVLITMCSSSSCRTFLRKFRRILCYSSCMSWLN